MNRPYDQDLDEHCVHCGSEEVYIITLFGAECKPCMEDMDLLAEEYTNNVEWVQIIPQWRWN